MSLCVCRIGREDEEIVVVAEIATVAIIAPSSPTLLPSTKRINNKRRITDADAALVTSLDWAPPDKHRQVSKLPTTGIHERRIQCKKCQICIKYSSSRSVKVNSKTGHETISIKAICGICTHPTKGGNLYHECWLELDKPTDNPSLFHVQPAYYSVNHCVHVVDPANLATIPNASLGSLTQGVLWPTGIQATLGTPAVVKGVYCTDTVARGIAHCSTYHLNVLDKERPRFVSYEIKPSHPAYNNFLNISTPGFFVCMAVVDVSPVMVNAGRVVITHI